MAGRMYVCGIFRAHGVARPVCMQVLGCVLLHVRLSLLGFQLYLPRAGDKILSKLRELDTFFVKLTFFCVPLHSAISFWNVCTHLGARNSWHFPSRLAYVHGLFYYECRQSDCNIFVVFACGGQKQRCKHVDCSDFLGCNVSRRLGCSWQSVIRSRVGLFPKVSRALE